ncbi:MAG: HEAT repeat domain-containing protein [Nitrospira defluvii]|nr:HEAT repeat domain-containing protein [Nitrospira defluvii]
MPSAFAIHLIFWLLFWSVMAGCYVDAPPAGPDVMSARLGELLADPDPDMRRTAAEALGKIGHRSARSGLISALNDREACVRSAAALSLGRLGDAESGTALVQSLSDPAEAVRVAAALALGEIEPSPVSEALILARLRHTDGPERMAASRALLGLDTISFSGDLAGALRDTDQRIRQGVAAVLGETGDVRAVPHLLSLLRTDAVAGVRTEAAFRLGKIGDDRVMPDLAKVATSDSDLVVRGWARWAMQQIKQSRESGSGSRPSR